MEHRWSKRHPTDIDISLRIGSQSRVECVAENVSSGGLFARVPDVNLAKNSIVEVEFKDIKQVPFEHNVLSAMVAHSSSEGVGLAFDSIEESIWRWLKERTKAQSNTG